MLLSRVHFFDGLDCVPGLALYGPQNELCYYIDCADLFDAASNLEPDDTAHYAIGSDGKSCDTYDSAGELCRDLHTQAFRNQLCGYSLANVNNGATSGNTALFVCTVYYREPILKP